MLKRLTLLLMIASPCFGQAWSGILSSSRAVDWSGAGLPATFPDGETSVNQYTPPVRTQCGSTLAASSSLNTITTALAACANGTYVLIGPGTLTVNNTNWLFGLVGKSVTLRGSGPMQTTMALTGSANLSFANANGGGSQPITSTLTQGGTSLTIAALGNLQVGQVALIQQCDTGTTGSSCTGVQFDNGGDFICGGTSVCQVSPGEGFESNIHQTQTIRVSSITGTGPYTVNFSPAIIEANWSAAKNPFLSWTTTFNSGFTGIGPGPTGLGLENFTIDISQDTTSQNPIQLNDCYGCWFVGNRVIGVNSAFTKTMLVTQTNHCLIANNYIVPNWPPANSTGNAVISEIASGDTDSLDINNIMQGHIQWEGFGLMTRRVLAYNYFRESHTPYYEGSFNHTGGGRMMLWEGNEGIRFDEESVHAIHTLDTYFRNMLFGYDPPYVSPVATAQTPGCFDFSGGRLMNLVGNSCGNSTSNSITNLNVYITNLAAGCQKRFVYLFGCGNQTGGDIVPVDTLATSSMMLWGNCDTVNAACRFVSGEVPSALHAYAGTQTLIGTGNGVTTAFAGTVGAGGLPCILGNEVLAVGNAQAVNDPGFNGTLSGTGTSSGSANCTTGVMSVTFASAPANGAPVYANTIKDLGSASAFQNPVPSSHTLPNSFFLPSSIPTFWGVCVAWSVFPTSCSSTSTPPWPFVGPDVTGGPYVVGTGYDNPATVAWKNLPVDTSLQQTYTITGSSWAGGVETITLTGFPTNSNFFEGGFRFSGAPAGCRPASGDSFTGRSDNEILMNGSNASAQTFTYLLPINPGVSCTGSILFPDVRQFDARVYSASAPTCSVPTIIPGSQVFFNTFSATITASCISIIYTTDGSTPTASGACAAINGTLYTVPISISATTTLSAIACQSGSTTSSVTIANYTLSTPAPSVPMLMGSLLLDTQEGRE